MRKLLLLLIVVGLGYWAWRQSHRFARTLDDGTLTAQVLAEMAKSKPLSLLTVKISVSQRTVDLKGHVRTAQDENDLVRLVRGVNGVSAIRDRLTVDKGIRTQDEIETDLKLMGLIKKNLIEEEGLRGLQIHVSVDQGTVLLTGEVPSGEQARLASQIAKSVKGVKEVRSQIKVHEVGMK